MEENKTENKKNINWKNVLWRTAAAIFVVYAILVIARMSYVHENRKTEEQVAKIHATKLTMNDVMGVNLPPDPGAVADDTIEGIDANKNGIRDDVELAIFKEYSNSAKTRAVLLQYALALQMETTQPIVNEGTVGTIANKEEEAFFCIAELFSNMSKIEGAAIIDKYEKFVLVKQLNTKERNEARDKFYKNLTSGTIAGSNCNVDLKSFPN